MKIVIITIFIFLSGCAGLIPRFGIHEDFKPYADEFQLYYGKELKSSISYADYIGDTPEVIGACYRFTRNILVLRSFWEKATHNEKLFLIFHELGHCELNRGHYDGSTLIEISGTKFIMPVSIMNTYAFDMSDYPEVKQYYINELFSGN